MDIGRIPFRVEERVATFAGEWTAEDIDAGRAGKPVVTSCVTWYEPGPDGPIEVTDPVRIAELESRLGGEEKQHGAS